MNYTSFDVWWWPYIFIIVAGVLPTNVWRWAGVYLIGNVGEDSQWLVYVRCLADALVAAVVAQFVFFPTGALAAVPLGVRLVALIFGFAAFLALGRRVYIGVLVSQLFLMAGIYWL